MSQQDDFSTKMAESFITAEDNHGPVERVAGHYPDLTNAQAYQIQMAIIDRLKQRGAELVGYKVAATSENVQQMFGLTEPALGHLFDLHRVAGGTKIQRSQLVNPVVECEITFRLKEDLAGPGVTADDALAATEAVVASLELPDLRTHDWKVSALEVIGYNALAARFVLGQQWVSPTGLDLSQVSVVARKNGEQYASGTGTAALGHPANVVAWLANGLAQHGIHLQAGQIVMSGTLTPPEPASAGDTFEADFEGLGSVSATFE